MQENIANRSALNWPTQTLQSSGKVSSEFRARSRWLAHSASAHRTNCRSMTTKYRSPTYAQTSREKRKRQNMKKQLQPISGDGNTMKSIVWNDRNGTNVLHVVTSPWQWHERMTIALLKVCAGLVQKKTFEIHQLSSKRKYYDLQLGNLQT